MWIICDFICPHRYYGILERGYEDDSESGRCSKPSHCPSFLVFLEFHLVVFILDVIEQFWFILTFLYLLRAVK